MRNYTGPVTVSGKGTHTIRAVAVNAAGQYSKISELTVIIESREDTALVP